jgi:hypothetical protein
LVVSIDITQKVKDADGNCPFCHDEDPEVESRSGGSIVTDTMYCRMCGTTWRVTLQVIVASCKELPNFEEEPK